MATSPLQVELEVACSLAVRAGALAVSLRGGELEPTRKARGEPVTIADLRASELIVEGLAEAFPRDAIVSEELPPPSAGAVRTWYVDPIDGTRDFIDGDDGFTVMIGLAEGGRPCLGVVYQPVGERLFFAAPGIGALVREPGGERAARCSPVSSLEEARLVGSRSHWSTGLERVCAALGVKQSTRVGSLGLKVALIATGAQDVYVNLSRETKSWDTCAPEAILLAAGGRLTDLLGGAVQYELPALSHPRGILATNGPLHGSALAVLDALRKPVE